MGRLLGIGTLAMNELGIIEGQKWRRHKKGHLNYRLYHIVNVFEDNEELIIVVKRWLERKQYWVYEVVSYWHFHFGVNDTGSLKLVE